MMIWGYNIECKIIRLDGSIDYVCVILLDYRSDVYKEGKVFALPAAIIDGKYIIYSNIKTIRIPLTTKELVIWDAFMNKDDTFIDNVEVMVKSIVFNSVAP